jgi:hypothetical protein
MRRRRLIAFALALALGSGFVAWWILADGLSAQERLLLGTWYSSRLPSNGFWPAGVILVHDFGPGRTCRLHGIDGRTGTDHMDANGRPTGMDGRWRVQNGDLVSDWGDGLIVRIRRALPAGSFGALPAKPDVWAIERLTPDDLVIHNRMGQVYHLTRKRPD